MPWRLPPAFVLHRTALMEGGYSSPAIDCKAPSSSGSVPAVSLSPCKKTKQRFLYGFTHRDLGVQGRCGVLLNDLHLPEMFFPCAFPPIDGCANDEHRTAAWPL